MKTGEPLSVMALQSSEHNNRSRCWTLDWRAAISQAIDRWDANLDVDYQFVTLHDPCANVSAVPVLDDETFSSQVWAILGTAALDWLNRQHTSARRHWPIRDGIRHAAREILGWLQNEPLRLRMRQELEQQLSDRMPDVLLAHGLGSLVAYDVLSRAPRARCKSLIFVSFGSPLGTECLQAGLRRGGVKRLTVRHWYHLFNRHDDTFTARISLDCDNFTQINTPFRHRDFGSRAAPDYLAHAAMSERVWRVLLERARFERSLARFRRTASNPCRARRTESAIMDSAELRGS